MKIALIISGNLFMAPYLELYLNFLNKSNLEYDVISWNRKLINEPVSISYNSSQTDKKGYVFRLYSYLGYRKFVIDNLRKNNYDKVYVSTIAIAVLLYPYLKKNYYQRYLFDIRDYSIILKFTSKIFKRLVDNSAATVISSAGFRLWLPRSSKYIVTHNFPFKISARKIQSFSNGNDFDQNSDALEIATIGSFRDYNACKTIMNAFKNCEPYILNFIGSGPVYEPLRQYAAKNKIQNILFYGQYNKEEEIDLLKNASFINNFTSNDLNSRTLVTNRFYLSAVLGIPMIVRSGTHQASICAEYNLGCIVQPEKDIKVQLVNYVNSFNKADFKAGCTRFLNEVENDIANLETLMLNFVELS